MTKFKARPTNYKGIQMRSRLEAGFAQWLDHFSFNWEYEPECFAHEGGQYLPDFLLRQVLVAGAPQDVYIEVKPTTPDVRMRQKLVAQNGTLKASKPDADLAVAFPQNEDIWSSPSILSVPHFADWVWTYKKGDSLGLDHLVGFESGPWPDRYWEAT